MVWSVGRAIFTDAPLDLIPPDVVFMAFAAGVFPLVLWLAATVFIYAYLVLSGIVASELGRRQSSKRGEARKRSYWG